MEKSFVVQLFKNPLWAQLRDGRCRERDSEVLWECWSFGLGFWRLIPSPVHPSGPGVRVAGVSLPLTPSWIPQIPSLSPGAAPAPLFCTAKQKERGIKAVAGRIFCYI